MTSIDAYIDELYKSQNIGADSLQQNLVSREYYEEQVKKVLQLIRENKDASLEELRQKLYENSGVEESIKHFIYDRKMAPGGVVTYGTKNFQETIFLGNQEEAKWENGKKIDHVVSTKPDAIIDLASTTKLFTAIATLKLVCMNEIGLLDDVTLYAPQFENLKGITIFDLLTFIPLKTDKRVDAANSIEEAESILFTTSRKEIKKGENPYNDFASMVLKYVIEKVSGMSYYDFLKYQVLSPFDMNDTLVKIPEEKMDRVMSGNGDVRYYKDGNVITRDYIDLGVSTDDKARVLGQPQGILSGHAGIFSTAKDMEKLARALINGKLVPGDVRRVMGRNRTGQKVTLDDGTEKTVQFLGMGCHSKNPNLANSEVHHPLSGEAFAAAGWSGTQLTVDPIQEINFFMGCNRSHNRATFIDNIHKDKIITDENGKRTIILPDGREIIDASGFALDSKEKGLGRDGSIVHPCIELAQQYKILEDIIGLQEEKNLPEEKVREL